MAWGTAGTAATGRTLSPTPRPSTPAERPAGRWRCGRGVARSCFFVAREICRVERAGWDAWCVAAFVPMQPNDATESGTAAIIIRKSTRSCQLDGDISTTHFAIHRERRVKPQTYADRVPHTIKTIQKTCLFVFLKTGTDPRCNYRPPRAAESRKNRKTCGLRRWRCWQRCRPGEWRRTWFASGPPSPRSGRLPAPRTRAPGARKCQPKTKLVRGADLPFLKVVTILPIWGLYGGEMLALDLRSLAVQSFEALGFGELLMLFD